MENLLPEIVAFAYSNPIVCENVMYTLQLLSEDVFEYSAGQMTAQKTKELQGSFQKGRTTRKCQTQTVIETRTENREHSLILLPLFVCRFSSCISTV
jgi:hypothetical protein